MENTERSEVVNYGNLKFAEGYEKGYQKAHHERRRRLSLKEKSRFTRFGHFIDWLTEEIADNKKH